VNANQMRAWCLGALQVGTTPADTAEYGFASGATLPRISEFPLGDNWVPVAEGTYCPFADVPHNLASDEVYVSREGVCYVGCATWALCHFRFVQRAEQVAA